MSPSHYQQLWPSALLVFSDKAHLMASQGARGTIGALVQQATEARGPDYKDCGRPRACCKSLTAREPFQRPGSTADYCIGARVMLYVLLSFTHLFVRIWHSLSLLRTWRCIQRLNPLAFPRSGRRFDGVSMIDHSSIPCGRETV
jgi:hypothetical protein